MCVYVCGLGDDVEDLMIKSPVLAVIRIPSF